MGCCNNIVVVGVNHRGRPPRTCPRNASAGKIPQDASCCSFMLQLQHVPTPCCIRAMPCPVTHGFVLRLAVNGSHSGSCFSACCAALLVGQASSSNLGDTAVISTAGSYSPSTSRLNLVSGQHGTTSALGAAGRRNSVQVGHPLCCKHVAHPLPVKPAGPSTCQALLVGRCNSV